MLNFRDEQLYINGERVNQLCVVGVAAERFWELAFCDGRGLGSLVWTDVTSVKLWDVTKKMSGGHLRRVGSAEVRLEPADSQMALGVARAACERLEEMDYRILDAGIEQMDGEGHCVGAHDLICERRQARGPLISKIAPVQLVDTTATHHPLQPMHILNRNSKNTDPTTLRPQISTCL